MNLDLLQAAVNEMKSALEEAIQNAVFNGKEYEDGQKAKEALIRSQGLILPIHEVVKRSLAEELQTRGRRFTTHPAVGRSTPELCVSGFIKAKDQDVVVLFDGDEPVTELITEGPLSGNQDSVGRHQSERSIVIGVRSQMSSVAKNFDTLMERAFAETLNLRLRLPRLTMGEVYVLPVREYNDAEMKNNRIAWKGRTVNVLKFIKTFLSITHRLPENSNTDLYKYERSALVLVDFSLETPVIYQTLAALQGAGIVPQDCEENFSILSPQGFASDLLNMHAARHPAPSQT